MQEGPAHDRDFRTNALDELIRGIRYESGIEAGFEKERNLIVENHPYLVGYVFLAGVALLVSISHLMVFAISFLFLYFISDFMTQDVRRVASFVPKVLLFSVLYILVVLTIILITYKVIPLLARNFPELTSQLQVQIVKELQESNQKWNLSEYIDIDMIKGSAKQASTWILHFLLDSLSPVYKGIIQCVFALVINLLLYFESERVARVFTRNPDSLMTFLYRFSQVRLRIFYAYFRRVMGGQVIIALINTAISSAAIIALGLPHPFLLIFIVFFCGLFPVVGNLISNTVLILSAFVSIGLWGAGVCLALLVFVHKLEYFLNSKIIGDIVQLPMAISLTALIVAEVLLGIPGLILAIPLALFIRHEFEHIPGFKRE